MSIIAWQEKRYEQQEEATKGCTLMLEESMDNFDQLMLVSQVVAQDCQERLDILGEITVETSMDSGAFLAWFKLYAESFGFHACIE
jgi:hypothetical protein